MKYCSFVFILVFVLTCSNVFAVPNTYMNELGVPTQDYIINDKNYAYHKPGFFDFAKNLPETQMTFFKTSFAKDNWQNLAWITGTTILTWYYDYELYKETQRFGRKIGIGNEENTKGFAKVGGISLFRGPTDVGSALYFLGDGWMNAGIMGGFLGTGWAKDDYRALQTGSQLAHGLLIGTIANQILKRSTGRQSPCRIDENGNKRGNWHFFPSSTEYGDNTSNYDAFPSGHLATTMMTWTVITENYSEYNYWLKPAQWTYIGLLSFEMVNNGVHWVSDYPLAIGMGYLYGKIAVSYGRKEKNKNDPNATLTSRIYYAPIYDQNDGTPGVAAKLDF